jgi:hypothetical protein
MGVEKDLPPGEHLLACFRPFIKQLASSSLPTKTGAPPGFHGAGKTFRPSAAKNIGLSDCRILFEAGKAKWKSRLTRVTKQNAIRDPKVKF